MPDADNRRSDNLAPLKLHIPEPRFRPGDTPDFSDIVVPAAGETTRPSEDCAPQNMRDNAYGLVRVLGSDDLAVGPWDPRLSPEKMRTMLRYMLVQRAFDDRMFRAQRLNSFF